MTAEAFVASLPYGITIALGWLSIYYLFGPPDRKRGLRKDDNAGE